MPKTTAGLGGRRSKASWLFIFSAGCLLASAAWAVFCRNSSLLASSESSGRRHLASRSFSTRMKSLLANQLPGAAGGMSNAASGIVKSGEEQTLAAAATITALQIEPATKLTVPNACKQISKEFSKCVPTAYFIGASKCATTSFAFAFRNHPFMNGVAGGHESSALSHGAPSAKSEQGSMKCTNKAQMGSLEVKHMNSKRLVANGTTVNDDNNGTLPLTYFYRPDALYYPHAACNLALAEIKFSKQLGYPYRPEARRFLVMLREPLARTFSSWAFKSEGNGEHRPWSVVVRHGLGILASIKKCLKSLSKQPGFSSAQALEDKCAATRFDPRMTVFHHVMKSVYSLQFEVWFHHFPKRFFHIVFMEDFIMDPLTTLENSLDFLGIPMVDEGEGNWGYPTKAAAEKVVRKVKNKTGNKKHNLEAPTKSTRAALEVAFGPFNCQLAQQLGLGRAAKGHWITGHVSTSMGPGSSVSWLTDWGPVLESATQQGDIGGDSPCRIYEYKMQQELKELVNRIPHI